MFQINLTNGASPLIVVGSQRRGLVLAERVKGNGTEWVVWNYFLRDESLGGGHICEYGVYFKTLREAQDYLARKMHGDIYPTI